MFPFDPRDVPTPLRRAIVTGVVGLSFTASATATDGSLVPSGLAANDFCGLAIALEGDVLAIGAVGDDDVASNSGSVFVYERIGGAWNEVAKLTAADPVVNAQFGRSVAIDGTRLAIGAPGAFGNSAATGAVYVYEREGSGWQFTTKIAASDGAPGDEFGAAVSVDGNRVLIGAAAGDGVPFVPDSGAAYVFEHVGGTWIEAAKLLELLHGQQLDGFGRVADLSGDRAVFGVPAGYGPGAASGRAAIFERIGNGWTLAATLYPEGISFANGLEYGRAVAIEGDRAVVTSPFGGPATGFTFAPGMADVYRRVGSSWQLDARVVPVGTDLLHQWGMEFGVSAALDGETLVVGAADSLVDGDGRGAAYVFERLPVGWVQVAVLHAADSSTFDFFASSIAVSAGTVAVGVPLDDESGTNSGSVSLFEVPGARSPVISAAPNFLSPFVPGDRQHLRVDLGSSQAGRIAWMLGSFSGTTPGLALGAFHLPLQYDFYFEYTLAAPAIGPLVPGIAMLDSEGVAEFEFVMPVLGSEVSHLLLGLSIHHAALILEPGTNQVRAVTNAVPLTFAG